MFKFETYAKYVKPPVFSVWWQTAIICLWRRSPSRLILLERGMTNASMRHISILHINA